MKKGVLNTLSWMGLAILGLTLLVGAITGIGYGAGWWLRGPGKFIENSRTDVIRETNQYTASTRDRLYTLLSEYQGLPAEAPQRAAIVNEMHNLAGNLGDDRTPDEIRAFLALHPRGSR